MTNQATHEFEAAAISEKAIAEGAKVKRPTVSAVQQRADVKGALLRRARGEQGVEIPHGDKGQDFATLTVDRLSAQWKVDEDGKRLSDAEVFQIKEMLPGTKANKAFKTRTTN